MKHIFSFQHRYWPISVQHSNSKKTSLISFLCNCGKAKAKLVDGIWTLEEVKAIVINKIADKLKI